MAGVRKWGLYTAREKICYLEIPANAAEASAEFYSRSFGWKVRTRGDGDLAFDDTDVIAETWQRIVAEGGRVTTPRMEIGQSMGAFAAFVDPVGNTFGLYEEPS